MRDTKIRKRLRKAICIALSVALINSSMPPCQAEASWFSDLCGGLFTFITAPIWVFCPDNPTFRKNNPFRKKKWEEEINFQPEPEEKKNEVNIPSPKHIPVTSNIPDSRILSEEEIEEARLKEQERVWTYRSKEEAERLRVAREEAADAAKIFHPSYATDHVQRQREEAETLARDQERQREEDDKADILIQNSEARKERESSQGVEASATTFPEASTMPTVRDTYRELSALEVSEAKETAMPRNKTRSYINKHSVGIGGVGATARIAGTAYILKNSPKKINWNNDDFDADEYPDDQADGGDAQVADRGGEDDDAGGVPPKDGQRTWFRNVRQRGIGRVIRDLFDGYGFPPRYLLVRGRGCAEIVLRVRHQEQENELAWTRHLTMGQLFWLGDLTINERGRIQALPEGYRIRLMNIADNEQRAWVIGLPAARMIWAVRLTDEQRDWLRRLRGRSLRTVMHLRQENRDVLMNRLTANQRHILFFVIPPNDRDQILNLPPAALVTVADNLGRLADILSGLADDRRENRLAEATALGGLTEVLERRNDTIARLNDALDRLDDEMEREMESEDTEEADANPRPPAVEEEEEEDAGE